MLSNLMKNFSIDRLVIYATLGVIFSTVCYLIDISPWIILVMIAVLVFICVFISAYVDLYRYFKQQILEPISEIDPDTIVIALLEDEDEPTEPVRAGDLEHKKVLGYLVKAED